MPLHIPRDAAGRRYCCSVCHAPFYGKIFAERCERRHAENEAANNSEDMLDVDFSE